MLIRLETFKCMRSFLCYFSFHFSFPLLGKLKAVASTATRDEINIAELIFES